MENPSLEVHPEGEKQNDEIESLKNKVAVDTYDGRVHIEWDHDTPVTPMGQLAFFIEFLKRTELFDHWIDSCPLKLTSPNAPKVRDILGTILLSVLSGHTRYSHITAIRSDQVNAPLLGMKKIMSEDSVRRALIKIAETEGSEWLTHELKHCYSEVLNIPWILDVDTTIKSLFGKQEGAVVGYNPKKPGRPSHTYHTYMIAAVRMILDVEVMPGNESSASHTQPHLFSWLDDLPREKWPEFLRGDCGFGTDAVMEACEARSLNYLFKLKQTKNVKRFIELKMTEDEWHNAGQGWQGCSGELQLMSWKRARGVVLLRRKIKKDIGVVSKEALTGQTLFQFAEMGENISAYEYAVLVTDMDLAILSIACHYRDRADCENNFDELKNQWGWSGYTTTDLHRCRLMAKIIALIYNWWTLFVRLITPGHHVEAITSRPLLLHAVGKQIKHAGHKIIQVNSNHAKFKKVQGALISLSDFFKTLKPCAEQLSMREKMKRVLHRAFEKFIGELPNAPPKLLPAPS
jgi:hypothetical protein